MTAIAIIGSRTYPDLSEVRRFVRRLPSGTMLISGGAQGVDATAAKAAKARGFEVREFLPDLPRYGSPAAYYRRNEQIVRETKALGGRLVAFAAREDGQITKGTAMTLGIAERDGLPAEVIECRIAPTTLALIDALKKAWDAYGRAPIARRKERYGAYQQARQAVYHRHRDLIEWLQQGLLWLDEHVGHPQADQWWEDWNLALVTCLCIDDAMDATRVDV